jgi:Anthrax toxin LF subunit
MCRMSKMPEYDATAGFPQVHVQAFNRVACRFKMVIASRELNPLCTDLVLEGYAAKGFHIKAKTCDWGPMAGFVPEDPRFTKGKQNPEDQRRDIGKAFEHGARCAPLFIDDARLQKLIDREIVKVAKKTGDRCEVTAAPEGGQDYTFILVKQHGIAGCAAEAWGIYYQPGQQGLPATYNQHALPHFPRPGDLLPVNGMTNPDPDTKLGARAAVAGDYDLWCVFPHSSVKDSGIENRMMPLKATLISNPAMGGGTMAKLMAQQGENMKIPQQPGAFVTQQAKAAGFVWKDKAQLIATANQKEDQHLGNISQTIMKIRAALNQECKSAGGDVVQHSDYGGNPFGSIDYPLIFFIPDPPNFSMAGFEVADNLADLKNILRNLQKKDYLLKLNPAWSVPLY